jgi:hypothetical protein
VKKEEDWEEFFEDDATRELKQIFQGQAALTDTVRELHRKMDEIIGIRLIRIYADSAADSHTTSQCSVSGSGAGTRTPVIATFRLSGTESEK